MGPGARATHALVQPERLHAVLRGSAPRHTLGAPFRRGMWKGFRQGLRRELARMLRAAATTLTCAALALTGAACGQSASGGDDDPATLVPADAPVYVEGSVRPEEALRGDALAAAGKILRTDDPAGELR